MNKKNWLSLIIVCAIALTSFNSCSKDKNDDTTPDNGPVEWFQRAAFNESPRNGAASFVINNVGYVVGGYVKNKGVVNDATSFDGLNWSRIESFPGTARQMAVGFAINETGYIGLGSTGTEDLKDFYKYDAKANTWTKIADFPGTARYGAVAFTLGNAAYVCFGAATTDDKFNDIYKYDPATNKWTELPTPLVNKKAFAFSFVIGDKAYVGGGLANSSNLPADFYSFDGKDWVKLADLNRKDSKYTYDARKYNAGAFAIGNYGYVVSGKNGASITNSVWKYEPATDSWTDKHQALIADAREKAVSFALNGKGYIVTGINGTFNFDTNYEFSPVR